MVIVDGPPTGIRGAVGTMRADSAGCDFGVAPRRCAVVCGSGSDRCSGSGGGRRAESRIALTLLAVMMIACAGRAASAGGDGAGVSPAADFDPRVLGGPDLACAACGRSAALVLEVRMWPARPGTPRKGQVPCASSYV